jgi:hypothetical protein
MVVGEVAGVQNLDASIVLTIEGCESSWAACRLGHYRRAKPETKVVHLYWIEGRVQASVWEWSIDDDWSRIGSRCDCKSLDTEAAHELLMSSTMFVSFDVPEHRREDVSAHRPWLSWQ